MSVVDRARGIKKYFFRQSKNGWKTLFAKRGLRKSRIDFEVLQTQCRKRVEKQVLVGEDLRPSSLFLFLRILVILKEILRRSEKNVMGIPYFSKERKDWSGVCSIIRSSFCDLSPIEFESATSKVYTRIGLPQVYRFVVCRIADQLLMVGWKERSLVLVLSRVLKIFKSDNDDAWYAWSLKSWN